MTLHLFQKTKHLSCRHEGPIDGGAGKFVNLHLLFFKLGAGLNTYHHCIVYIGIVMRIYSLGSF